MRLLILIVPVALSACASILEGRSQTIAVSTTPAGADCEVKRDGFTIGRVNPTPGDVTIQKTKRDIEVTCHKPGYEPVSFSSRSDFAAPFFGNILVGGPIGMGIDLSTGAYNKYDAAIAMDLNARSAQAINTSPREKAAITRPLISSAEATAGTSTSASEPSRKRILASDHADRYQARREQLRKQK